MNRFALRCVAFLSLVAAVFAQPLDLVPFHPNGTYNRGEPVGWTVTARPGTVVPEGGYSYTLNLNNAVLLQAGKVDPSRGPARIAAQVAEPAMVYLEILP